MPGRVATHRLRRATTWSSATAPGPSAFIDDRADVFPPAVEKDYGVLLSGSAGWQAVLARYRFDVVLWPRSERPGLARRRRTRAGRCRISDRRWVVAVPRNGPVG